MSSSPSPTPSMPSSQAEANTLLWKAYASAILQMLNQGEPVGSDTRIYFASKNHSAIPGGSAVPAEITNWGIYSLGNNLLDANGGVTFNPTAGKGNYIEALTLYLGAIKSTGNNENPQTMAQLNAAKANEATAYSQMLQAQTQAYAQWKVDPNGQGTTPWNAWYPQNAPQYMMAQQNYQTTVGQVTLLTTEIYGPELAQLQQYQTVLQNAQNTTFPLNPGVTMEASQADITLNSDMSLNIPSQLNNFTVPAYTIQGYGAALDGWMLTTTPTPATYTISSDIGKSFSFSSLGHSEAGGGGSDSLDLGIFSFSIGGSGSTKTETSSFDLTQWVDQITITLSVNFSAVMTITPGMWNVDVKDLASKMNVTPPANVTASVRPTQALFASGIGLTVQFSAAAATEFDTFYQKTQAAGGGFSLFGFRIGGDGSTSVTKSTHEHTWDSTAGTLTVPPVPMANNAQLLAVMGEVVDL